MQPRILVLFMGIVFAHACFNQNLQLHYDEAYYWVWSRNLQLSYFDHPPLIAYLVRAATCWSNSEFFVRLPALFCSTLTAILIFVTAKRLFTARAANITLILLLALPIFEGTFFILTIDSPLLMLWSLSLYCAVRGFIQQERVFIYYFGIALGFALLAKYTAVLILPGLLLFLLLSPRQRMQLRHKDLYLALGLSLIIFSPVLWWNYQHDWVSFRFQLHHGIAVERKINLFSFVDYIGALFGAANPFISVPLLVFLLIKRKQILANDKYLLLCSIFLWVVGFFAYHSLFKFMEANWVVPAFLSGVIFLGECLAQYQIQWVQRWAIGLILMILPFSKMPGLLPQAYHNKIPAINAFMGHKQLYLQIKNRYITPGDILLACDYGDASRGWYYLGLGRVYVLNNFQFSNSYSAWNQQLNFPIKHALYFCSSNDLKYLQQLSMNFALVQALPPLSYHDSFVNNKLYVYRVSN
jgi:4-amino-4-deoxy-L-arabinose transferase-like glycosyltransferase